MVNGPLIQNAATGAAVGTAIMPGAGTVAGAAVGGLVSLFGGPEAQQHQASIGGRSIDARQIYEQIRNGPGTGSLEQGSTAANELKQAHAARAQQIAALNKEMDAAWQGDSAQAAQAGGHPLETWLNDSANNLGTSHQFIGQQITDFSTVSNKVQPLPEKPPSMGFTDHINPFSDKDDEINAYNKKGQANVDAFNAYYQQSAQNAAGMPQYKAWTGNNISDGTIGNGGDGGGGSGGGGNGGSGGYGGGGSGSGGYPPGGGGNLPNMPGMGGGHGGGYGGSGGGAGGSGPGGTGSGGYNPNLPSTTLPGSGKLPSWNDGTTAAGFTPSTDYPSGFGPGNPSGFGSGDFGPGGSGSGSGSGAGGGYGVGGVGGFGPGGSG